MDTPRTQSPEPSNDQARQRRVQPLRNRRSTGVGVCDVDVSILESIKRRNDNEPIIPATTRFFLTTDNSLVPEEGASTSFLYGSGNEDESVKYFDRPEVIASTSRQARIQTPKWVVKSEVVSRFRSRAGSEATGGPDTSDAAYEKRHKKYENFEKKTRTREKEKLVHEHHKLKTRLEQLRTMDGTAFMNLSPDSFFAARQVHNEVDEGTRLSGLSAHNQGDHRRAIFLSAAERLDERYRFLLPPQKIRKLDGHREASMASDAAAEADELVMSDSEEEDSVPVESAPERLKIKIAQTQRQAPPASQIIASVSAPLDAAPPVKRKRGRPPKHRPPVELSFIVPQSSEPPSDFPASTPPLKESRALTVDLEMPASPMDVTIGSISAPVRVLQPQVPSPNGIPTGSMEPPLHIPQRQRNQPASNTRPRKPKKEECILLKTAERSKDAERQQARHTRAAFGVRLPTLTDDPLEYEPTVEIILVKGIDFLKEHFPHLGVPSFSDYPDDRMSKDPSDDEDEQIKSEFELLSEDIEDAADGPSKSQPPPPREEFEEEEIPQSDAITEKQVPREAAMEDQTHQSSNPLPPTNSREHKKRRSVSLNPPIATINDEVEESFSPNHTDEVEKEPSPPTKRPVGRPRKNKTYASTRRRPDPTRDESQQTAPNKRKRLVGPDRDGKTRTPSPPPPPQPRNETPECIPEPQEPSPEPLREPREPTHKSLPDTQQSAPFLLLELQNGVKERSLTPKLPVGPHGDEQQPEPPAHHEERAEDAMDCSPSEASATDQPDTRDRLSTPPPISVEHEQAEEHPSDPQPVPAQDYHEQSEENSPAPQPIAVHHVPTEEHFSAAQSAPEENQHVEERFQPNVSYDDRQAGRQPSPSPQHYTGYHEYAEERPSSSQHRDDYYERGDKRSHSLRYEAAPRHRGHEERYSPTSSRVTTHHRHTQPHSTARGRNIYSHRPDHEGYLSDRWSYSDRRQHAEDYSSNTRSSSTRHRHSRERQYSPPYEDGRYRRHARERSRTPPRMPLERRYDDDYSSTSRLPTVWHRHSARHPSPPRGDSGYHHHQQYSEGRAIDPHSSTTNPWHGRSRGHPPTPPRIDVYDHDGGYSGTPRTPPPREDDDDEQLPSTPGPIAKDLYSCSDSDRDELDLLSKR